MAGELVGPIDPSNAGLLGVLAWKVFRDHAPKIKENAKRISRLESEHVGDVDETTSK